MEFPFHLPGWRISLQMRAGREQLDSHLRGNDEKEWK